MYKSIMKKRRKEHDKIVLLAKAKLNTIELLIYGALINSYISHDTFVLANNVLNLKSLGGWGEVSLWTLLLVVFPELYLLERQG